MTVLTEKRIQLLLTALLISMLALVGCSQDTVNTMTGPQNVSTPATDGGALAKKGKGQGGGNKGGGNKGQVQFPISVSRIYEFQQRSNYYEGGMLKFGHHGSQSYFVLEDSALTPPSQSDWGKDVRITMDIDYDSTGNELQFTFGPHGCQFSPRAKIRLDYKRLGVDVANLYYIDDSGAYIPQSPDQVNVHGKWVMLSVDHFSRYALSAD